MKDLPMKRNQTTSSQSAIPSNPPPPPPPTGETPKQKFRRLANKRVGQLRTVLRQIDNLGSNASYPDCDAQRNVLLQVLAEEFETTRAALLSGRKNESDIFAELEC